MNKFLITASVVSAFLIGFAAPASAVDVQNEDNTEYAVKVYSHGADTVITKSFKLMPGQTLKGLCNDVCSVQIDDGRNSFDSHEAVASNSKVKVRQGRIVRN